jgi:hypothetical protein
MDPDFIRRVCEIFGVSAEDVIGGIGEVTEEIDPIKLTELVMLSRERLANLAEDEARELIRVLISASRKPQR